jgi:hypothetical protein
MAQPSWSWYSPGEDQDLNKINRKSPPREQVLKANYLCLHRLVDAVDIIYPQNTYR